MRRNTRDNTVQMVKYHQDCCYKIYKWQKNYTHTHTRARVEKPNFTRLYYISIMPQI